MNPKIQWFLDVSSDIHTMSINKKYSIISKLVTDYWCRVWDGWWRTWGSPAPTMAPLCIIGPSFPTNRPKRTQTYSESTHLSITHPDSSQVHVGWFTRSFRFLIKDTRFLHLLKVTADILSNPYNISSYVRIALKLHILLYELKKQKTKSKSIIITYQIGLDTFNYNRLVG